MKHWKLVSVTTAAVLAGTLGAGLTARAATPESVVRASKTTLTVSITGPGTVGTNVACGWEAQVSGGTPPYTYDWATNYDDPGLSTDPYFSAPFPNEGPQFVNLIVRDANMAQAAGGKGVYVRDGHQSC